MSSLYFLFFFYILYCFASPGETIQKAQDLIAQNDLVGAHALFSNYLEKFSDCPQVRQQRGLLSMKSGQLVNAHRDFTMIINGNHPPASTCRAYLQRALIHSMDCDLEEALKDINSAIRLRSEIPVDEHVELENVQSKIKDLIELKANLDSFLEKKDINAALKTVSKILTTCPSSPVFRKIKADIYLSMGSPSLAMHELRASVNKNPTDSSCSQLALLHLNAFFDLNAASKVIQHCARKISDNLLVSKANREIRAAKNMIADFDKAAANFAAQYKAKYKTDDVDFKIQCGYPSQTADSTISNAQVVKTIKSKLNEIDPSNQYDGIRRELYRALCKNSRKLTDCPLKIISVEKPCIECIKIVAETYAFELDSFEKAFKALEDIKKLVASEYVESIESISKDLKKTRRKEEKVDHYKVLGITKKANANDIKKAYRDRARFCHPDKVKSVNGNIGKSQDYMAKINKAQEILSNPKKRKLYDQGIDPEDPNAENFHRNPFHGQNPFQGQDGGGHFFFQGNPFDFFQGHPF